MSDFQHFMLFILGTSAVARNAVKREQKKNIWTDFYSTDATTNHKWKKANISAGEAWFPCV
jgi:hypothetical protein